MVLDKLFAGLDVSTQSCKIVVINLKSRNTVLVDSVNYDIDLPQYKTKNGVAQNRAEGVSESDPRMWVDAVNMVFDKLKKSNVSIQQIECISVSGQQHGLVALDQNGNLSRSMSKLWNDFSTLEECQILTDKTGGPDKMIEEVGNSQRTGYTAAKIFHMVRHEPEIYSKTTILFLVHNYINWYLTGGVCVMEPGDLSGMALWNPKTQKWSEKVIHAIDAGLKAKLPDIQPSTRSIGRISSQLVSQYGFSPDCRIDAGSGDNMYGAIGTGNVVPGIVTISLGTSGTAYTFINEPYVDPSGEIASFCDSTGNFLPLLCVSNLANGYNDILKIHNISHQDFGVLAGRTPPGNEGRLLLPWYMGERTPDIPKAAPLYFGFGLDDFTPENLGRAVLEGHILNLFDGFQRMPVQVSEIRLTGGLSQSPVWCQAIADIFNSETVPVKGEGAALGAALHAAWVWTNENDKKISIGEVAEPFVSFNESLRVKPIEKNVSIYNKQKELFRSLSRRVRGMKGDDPFEIRSQMILKQ